MNEEFLQLIWQFQMFAHQNLKSVENEEIAILFQGWKNKNSGADFSEAKIKIGEILWIGNVEIHLKSSDWFKHFHHQDLAYQNTILHVVWENDAEIFRQDQTKIPTLVLKDLISTEIFEKIDFLLHNQNVIPCTAFWQKIPEIYRLKMSENVLIERFQRKSAEILEKSIQNQNDWEKISYEMLLKNFGFSVNTTPFERLSKLLPFRIIQKHQNHLPTLEALLFGVSGFLDENFTDNYPNQLKKDFLFLKHKYQLSALAKHEWKFSKLRPQNFPTIRLAQLAALFHKHSNFFTQLIAISNKEVFYQFFDTNVSDYWKNYFIFDKPSKFLAKKLSQNTIDLLIINTVIPLKLAFSTALEQENHHLSLLEKLPAEQNFITQNWENLGWKVQNALESQASIEWFKNYCQLKKCYDCLIGKKILNPKMQIEGES